MSLVVHIRETGCLDALVVMMNGHEHIRVADTFVVAEDTHAFAVSRGIFGDGLEGERVCVDCHAMLRSDLRAGVRREGRWLGLIQRVVGPVARMAAFVCAQVCREHAIAVYG